MQVKSTIINLLRIIFNIYLSGTNKTQYVINTVIVEPVRLQRFIEAQATFLVVGHTKTLADEMFADITHVCTKQDIFNH